MKKIIIAIFVVLAYSIQNTSVAQTLVPPSPTNPDNLWAPGGYGVGINTALIDVIKQEIDDKNHPYRQLAACAWDAAAGGFVVTDFPSGNSLTFAYPTGSGNTMAGAPDVTWGNKAGSDIDFILAIAFLNNLGQVEVDYYDVHYNTPSTFTVTYNSFQAITPPVGYHSFRTVHIDVVAKSSNVVSTTNLPFCDPFFVTYDIGNTGVVADRVLCTYGNLNAYNALIAGPQDIGSNACFGQEIREPDVAGIERSTSPGVYEDIASLTYVQGKAGGFGSCMPLTHSYYLYYSEWDPMSPGTLCGGKLINYTTLSGTNALVCTSGVVPPDFAYPRIDANDNAFSNGTGMCQSKVVCELSGWGLPNTDTRIFSPMVPFAPGTSTDGFIDMSTLPGGFPPPTPLFHYNHKAPAVAYGQNTYNDYMVTECTVVPGTGDFFNMVPISVACASPVSGPSYYEVPTAYPSSPFNYANSVSTPCNNPSDTSIVAWTDFGNIFYKRSGYAGAYSYKPAPVALSASQNDLRIFPVPASDQINVSNPGIADAYSIRNMLGQEVAKGNLSATEQSIDVRTLPAGYYTIGFYRNGVTAATKPFVKNK